MEILYLTNLLILLVVFSIGTFRGLDLKRWTSWLYGLYGFLSGFFLGLFREDTNGGLKFVVDIIGSFQMGAIFAFLIMSTGAVTRWQRQYYGKKAESWLSRHGQEKHFTLLARMMRRIKKSPSDNH
jgi:hypothetical protein